MATKLKLRGMARFLASFFDGTGTKVRVDGLARYIDLNYADFQITPTIGAADLPNSYNLIWDEVKQTFAKVPVAAQSGVPGGSTSQVQYNNAGAFGGDAGLTYAAGGPLTINPTTSTINKGLVINQTLPSGSQSSGPYSGNQASITNNGYISTASGLNTTTGLLNNLVSGVRTDYLAAGSGAGQIPIQIGGMVTAAETSQGQQLVGFHASAASNIASAGNDSIWGFTGYSYVGPLANLAGSYASDAQSAITSGAVVANRAGVSIESIGSGSATGLDSGIAISSQSSVIAASPVPFRDAITLWTFGTTAPIATAGSVITANSGFTTANFVNLPAVTFTGKIFDFGSSVFQMDGIGNITSGATLIAVQNNNNGGTNFEVGNNSTGVSAHAAYVVENSLGSGGIGIASSGATFLPNVQNRVYIDAQASLSGILINNEGANPIIFGISNAEAARLDGATPGQLDLGVAGSRVGKLQLNNATSGTITITPVTGALGTGVATLPAGTYTIVGDSLTQTLTNKTVSATTNTVLLPYFSASLSANQGTTNNTFNKVLFNTKLADPNNFYDNTTNFRFQPLLAGKYQISAAVQASGTTVTEVDVDIYLNGSTYAREINLASGAGTSTPISKTVSFNGSTDFVEIFASALGTGTLNFLGGTAPIRSWFEARYLGP